MPNKLRMVYNTVRFYYIKDIRIKEINMSNWIVNNGERDILEHGGLYKTYNVFDRIDKPPKKLVKEWIKNAGFVEYKQDMYTIPNFNTCDSWIGQGEYVHGYAYCIEVATKYIYVAKTLLAMNPCRRVNNGRYWDCGAAEERDITRVKYSFNDKQKVAQNAIDEDYFVTLFNKIMRSYKKAQVENMCRDMEIDNECND